MTGLRETDDGRFHLTLVGLCRYDIVEELPSMRGYRQVVADYERYLSDLDPAPPVQMDRDQLLSTLKTFLDARELETDWRQS